MKNHRSCFTDCVSGKTVYKTKCSCGREWMTDSLFPVAEFKVVTDLSIERRKEENVKRNQGV